jgi:beta-glucosidase
MQVTGDAGSLDRLISPFGVCAKGDMDCVTLNALPAGNDVEMGGGTFNYRAIPSLVASGKLPLSVVDTAVSRQLRAKFELGIFEHANTALPASEWSSVINTPATAELARTLDRESIVLLQNPTNVLPLKKTAKVAVIGPMASGWMNYGDYVPHPAQMYGVTPLDGLQAAAADPSLITYALGVERWSTNQSGFAEAVAAATAADVAVVVVGTWSRDQNELWVSVYRQN